MEEMTPENSIASPVSQLVEKKIPRDRRALGQMFITLVLVILAFTAGWFGNGYYTHSTVPSSAQSYAPLIWEAWQDIDQHYVDQNAVDHQKMTYAAIQGMLSTLNDKDHTRFLTPQQNQQEQQDLSGVYAGVGIYVHQDPTTKAITITNPIPGTPADKAGIKAGDIIKQVDGKDISSDTVDQASKLIQGQEGTAVTLGIQRGSNPAIINFTMKRANIQVPNVFSYYISQDHVADIQIISFAQGVGDQVKQQLQQVEKEGAKAVILDLRDNPGGYQSEAESVASQFIPSGKDKNVMLEKDITGKIQPVPVQSGGVATNLPVVVLVNNNTASAAEIVAGALQDNNRAQVIGEKTFGTGTLLYPFQLSDGSTILLGVQEWLTPNGHFIRDSGITPNSTVSLGSTATPDTADNESNNNQTEQQILASGDAQKVAAVQYLEQHMNG